MSSSVLIVGATGGLGTALREEYEAKGWHVYCTTRSEDCPPAWPDIPGTRRWITNIDLTDKNVGDAIVSAIGQRFALDVVVSCPPWPQRIQISPGMT